MHKKTSVRGATTVVRKPARSRPARPASLKAKLAEAEGRCRTLLNHLLDGILVIDSATSTIVEANDAALRLLAYDVREDLLGRPLQVLFPEETLPDRQELIRRLRVHGHVIMSQRFRRAAGSLLLADLSASMVEWGRDVCILMVLREAIGQEGAFPRTGTGAPEAAAIATDTRRVLIAEDQAPLLNMFARILSTNLGGVKVDLAEDGEEAIQLFRRFHPAVVLLDVQMPVKGGDIAFLEIEQWCRDHDWEMPAVIFCTGYNIPATIRALVEASPRHTCLLKPVESTDLLAAIRARLPPRKA